MKAQEYVEQYMTGIDFNSEEDCIKRAKAMFTAFAHEVDDLCKKRGVKTLGGQEGVIREMNDKWNAVASRVEKMYNFKLVRRNVIWNMYLADTDPVRWPPKPDGGAA